MSVTDKIDKLEKKYAKDLQVGEKVLAHSDPLVILTNARLIELRMNGKFGTYFTLSEIEKIERQTTSPLKLNLVVITRDGATTSIPAGFKDQDWEDFQKIFYEAAASEDPEILHNMSQPDDRVYGQVMAQGHFGTRYVTIYSKGFVKVSTGMGLFKGEVEELLDIFGETDVNKKTGLGRAAGAVFTMGANLMLSPNQRGNLYLSIATNKQTHSLFWERPDATSIKILNRLVSAGKAAIASKTASGGAASTPPSGDGSNDIEEKLQRLADLFDKGLLDEAEFKASKAKLLGL